MKNLFKIKQFKFQLIFAIVIVINIHVHGQSKSISYGIGVNQMILHSDESIFKNQATKGAYIALDWLPSKIWGIGLEYNTNLLRESVSYWDLRFKMGFILFNSYRIQIPIYPSFHLSQIKNKDEDWYSAVGIGGKAGLKIFLSNKFAIEGYYHASMYFISATDEKRLESDAAFNVNSISLGIFYKI